MGDQRPPPPPPHPAECKDHVLSWRRGLEGKTSGYIRWKKRVFAWVRDPEASSTQQQQQQPRRVPPRNRCPLMPRSPFAASRCRTCVQRGARRHFWVRKNSFVLPPSVETARLNDIYEPCKMATGRGAKGAHKMRENHFGEAVSISQVSIKRGSHRTMTLPPCSQFPPAPLH